MTGRFDCNRFAQVLRANSGQFNLRSFRVPASPSPPKPEGAALLRMVRIEETSFTPAQMA